MNIGAASAASGVSAKMIRHYEAIGLLRRPRRANSYRDYGSTTSTNSRFIGRARRLGFSMAEIGELLALWRDNGRPSREVKRIAEAISAILKRASPKCRRWRRHCANWSMPATATIARTARSSTISRWAGAVRLASRHPTGSSARSNGSPRSS